MEDALQVLPSISLSQSFYLHLKCSSKSDLTIIIKYFKVFETVYLRRWRICCCWM